MLYWLLFTLFLIARAQKPCIQKQYGTNGAFTCVCNSTYCDEIAPIGSLGANQAAVFTTSASGKRLSRQVFTFTPKAISGAITITPDESTAKQTIFGFGGAFTDAVGINLQNLSSGTQTNLINAYYSTGNAGIGYTMGRVPMASCDFSLGTYSYDDSAYDFDLNSFALRPEDFNYKIPFIKKANVAAGGQLKLFASPWSAPAWMKSDNSMTGGGYLKGDVNGPYYITWANYFVRFFEEYSKNGITFWGATMQNEPGASQGFQSMLFSSAMERDFAKGVWGPTLRNNSLTKNLKLMVLDHNRSMLKDYAPTIFNDADAARILDGLAVHWYGDYEYGKYGQDTPGMLANAHNVVGPSKFLLYTEACNEGQPDMGGWVHADKYVADIINDLNNWVTGWVDWNLCLNPQGGPNWVNNFVDAPIIVSNSSDEFEKQPMYYGLGHFSKFLPPNSQILNFTMTNPMNTQNIYVTTGKAPDNSKVVIINNRDPTTTFQVSIVNKQELFLSLAVGPQSFTTVVYY